LRLRAFASLRLCVKVPLYQCGLAFLLLAVPPAQAQLTWTTNADNTVTITAYTGSGGDVVIPSTITGLAVTSIGDSAFANSVVTNVTIPGSVTSSVVSLTIATSPLIYGAARQQNGAFTLSFVSPPNSTNIVLSATNLAPPALWQPISTNLAGPDGDWQFTDTSAANYTARFYRAVTPGGP
jgi:hypothetical protein